MKLYTKDGAEATKSQIREAYLEAGFISMNFSDADLDDMARQRGVKLNKDQLDNLCDYIQRFKDCTIGFNWDSLTVMLEMWLDDNKIEYHQPE